MVINSTLFDKCHQILTLPAKTNPENGFAGHKCGKKTYMIFEQQKTIRNTTGTTWVITFTFFLRHQQILKS